VYRSVKRVERLMRAHGIVGHRPRRRHGLTRQDRAAPPAPDLLGRLFDPDQPDVAWCGDVERHEAPLDRAVVKGHRLQSVAAGW
jgi:hypothetical protein